MFCKRCGTELDNSAVFCPQCGAKINYMRKHNDSVKKFLPLFLLTLVVPCLFLKADFFAVYKGYIKGASYGDYIYGTSFFETGGYYRNMPLFIVFLSALSIGILVYIIKLKIQGRVITILSFVFPGISLISFLAYSLELFTLEYRGSYKYRGSYLQYFTPHIVFFIIIIIHLAVLYFVHTEVLGFNLFKRKKVKIEEKEEQ